MSQESILIFNIEVGDLSKSRVADYMTQIRNCLKPQLKKLGIAVLFVPTQNGVGKISLANPDSKIVSIINGNFKDDVDITAKDLLKGLEAIGIPFNKTG